jgi:hypothetical protein
MKQPEMRKGAKDGRTFVAGALPLSCTLAFGMRLQSRQFLAMVDPAIVRSKTILVLDPGLDLVARSDATAHPLLHTGNRPLFRRPRFDSWFVFVLLNYIASGGTRDHTSESVLTHWRLPQRLPPALGHPLAT